MSFSVMLSANPESGNTPFVTTFSASAMSDDPNETLNITNYNFTSNSIEGHSQSSSSSEATFTFNTTGLFTVTCAVTDDHNNTNYQTMQINVYEPPPSLTVLRNPYLITLKQLSHVVQKAEVTTNAMGNFDLERFTYISGTTVTIYEEFIQQSFKTNSGESIFLIACKVRGSNDWIMDSMWFQDNNLAQYYNQTTSKYNNTKPFVVAVDTFIINDVPEDSALKIKSDELLNATFADRTIVSTLIVNQQYFGNCSTPIALNKITYSGDGSPYILEQIDQVWSKTQFDVTYYAILLKASVKYPSSAIRECFNWHYGVAGSQFDMPVAPNLGSINPDSSSGWSQYM